MGACFNQLMENESKESLAQMVCDGFDKIATLEQRVKKLEDSEILVNEAHRILDGCFKDHASDNSCSTCCGHSPGYRTAALVEVLEAELAQARTEIEQSKLNAQFSGMAVERAEQAEAELAQARGGGERMNGLDRRAALAQRAAHAHTNLCVLATVEAVLESGSIYQVGRVDFAVAKIIAICRKEKQNQLKAYDRAISDLERA